MTSTEMNIASSEGDHKAEVLSPTEDVSLPPLNDTCTPLDFSELTPLQFGISVQSFTPAASLPNRKDKSRLAQIKARRKSSIGVRGSPETNSLIRFMAQQRMKTPPAQQTPELVRSSPFLPRVASTLKQKMASFQNLMDVDESEVCDPMPRQDTNIGGCIKTRDYLSDGNSCDGGKENHPPRMTLSKKRRLGSPDSCKVEIREASAPTLNFSLKQEEEEETVTQGPTPSSEAVEEAHTVLVSPQPHDDPVVHIFSLTKNQQEGVFELQSPSRTPPEGPADSSPSQPEFSFHISALPSLLEMKPTAENDSCRAEVKKKKRVRFGGPLSPEFFDKNLPPSTPLQRGATPARAPTPGGSLQLRSVLKTPQRSESQTPQAQPDLSSPTVFGASPTLAMPPNRRGRAVGDDGEESNAKIVFPSMDEIDSAVTSDAECTLDAQPLNLNIAFYEESLSQNMPESDNNPSTSSQVDALHEALSLPEMEKQPEADIEAPAQTQSKNRWKKRTGQKQESTSEAPARSSSRKRKQPDESEPVKRSTRSAAKSASGKMKMTSTATRKWNKDVDRSLYGSREYASKNPNLSPITEKLSFINQSPAAQLTPSTGCTGTTEETCLKTAMTNGRGDSDLSMTRVLEDNSEGTVASPILSKVSRSLKNRRLSGPRAIGRGLRKRKGSVSVDIVISEDAQEQSGEQTGEQTATNHEASCETTLAPTLEQGVDIQQNPQTAADTHEALDCHGRQDASSTGCPPSGKEPHTLPLEPVQRKTKPGRRSSRSSSLQQEQGSQAEEHQTVYEEEEVGQGKQAAAHQETNIGSSSDSQEGGVAHFDLAPWQTDFNFEDVFKPVATRGQRSVRRSLRNQSSKELSSSTTGLAWLPRTSPDSSKEARRTTRGRRLSAVQPSFLEEMQDDTS